MAKKKAIRPTAPEPVEVDRLPASELEEPHREFRRLPEKLEGSPTVEALILHGIARQREFLGDPSWAPGLVEVGSDTFSRLLRELGGRGRAHSIVIPRLGASDAPPEIRVVVNHEPALVTDWSYRLLPRADVPTD